MARVDKNHIIGTVTRESAYNFCSNYLPLGHGKTDYIENRKILDQINNEYGQSYGVIYQGKVIILTIVDLVSVKDSTDVPDDYKNKIGDRNTYMLNTIYAMEPDASEALAVKLLKNIISDKTDDVLIVNIDINNKAAIDLYISVGFRWAWDIGSISVYIKI